MHLIFKTNDNQYRYFVNRVVKRWCFRIKEHVHTVDWCLILQFKILCVAVLCEECVRIVPECVSASVRSVGSTPVPVSCLGTPSRGVKKGSVGEGRGALGRERSVWRGGGVKDGEKSEGGQGSERRKEGE